MAQRFEYKVVYADLRGRVSVEGEETLIQEGERMTAFGRRFLNRLARRVGSSSASSISPWAQRFTSLSDRWPKGKSRNLPSRSRPKLKCDKTSQVRGTHEVRLRHGRH